MKIFKISIICLITASIATQIKVQGQSHSYFIAHADCPGYQSFRRQTNPGAIRTEIDRTYVLIGKNKEPPSHFLIEMNATPRQRWVETSCGKSVEGIANGPTDNNSEDRGQRRENQLKQYLLAVNWQAGFCESRPTIPECRSQSTNRFDAFHFSLHGLWPQPRHNNYCHVAPSLISIDKNNNWNELPALALEPATRERLQRIMPGSQSYLHRHEWIKHGTCFGEDVNQYFLDSIHLLDALNTSSVRRLFVDHIDKQLTALQIRHAFDRSFGAGAGKRIVIRCKTDGDRHLITALLINIVGTPTELELSEAIMKAPIQTGDSCQRGLVDPVGLQ